MKGEEKNSLYRKRSSRKRPSPVGTARPAYQRTVKVQDEAELENRFVVIDQELNGVVLRVHVGYLPFIREMAE